MAGNNPQVSPEVAAQLVVMARQIRHLIYEDDGVPGVPVWGTKFATIEDDALDIGRELARLIMEQTVDEQAGRVPEHALQAGDEHAAPIGTQVSVVETPAGNVQWPQPKTRLKKARRDFFPSRQSAGD